MCRYTLISSENKICAMPIFRMLLADSNKDRNETSHGNIWPSIDIPHVCNRLYRPYVAVMKNIPSSGHFRLFFVVQARSGSYFKLEMITFRRTQQDISVNVLFNKFGDVMFESLK